MLNGFGNLWLSTKLNVTSGFQTSFNYLYQCLSKLDYVGGLFFGVQNAGPTAGQRDDNYDLGILDLNDVGGITIRWILNGSSIYPGFYFEWSNNYLSTFVADPNSPLFFAPCVSTTPNTINLTVVYDGLATPNTISLYDTLSTTQLFSTPLPNGLQYYYQINSGNPDLTYIGFSASLVSNAITQFIASWYLRVYQTDSNTFFSF